MGIYTWLKSPRTLFSDTEIDAIQDFAADRGLPKPGNLGRAVLTTAQLGGYLNRKHDSAPGHKIIWEGYTRLATIGQSYERLTRRGQTSKLSQKLLKGETYG